VTSHLFQARFCSVAMDEERLMMAARYVVLDPVWAQFGKRAETGAFLPFRDSVGKVNNGSI
jgi:hypothetical protein